MTTLKKRIVACLLMLCLALSMVACDLSSLIPTTPDKSSESSGSSEGAESSEISSAPSDEAEEESASDDAPAATVEKTYAYVAIDINPSLELVVADGVVEGVRACNDDAGVLLSDEELVGLSAEEATEKIVALCEELGYINDENTDVKVTVTADDEDEALELEEKAKNGVKKGSSRAIVNSNPRLADERTVKELKDENPELFKNLSPAKLRLIEAIMEYDPEMTHEVGVQMSVKELSELLSEYAKEYEGIVGEELKKKFEERKNELKNEKHRMIAEIYGEELLAAWNQIEALKALYEKISLEARTVEISDEDISAIFALIGIEDTSFLPEDIVITIKDVEKLFDRKFHGKFEQIDDEIEALLEKYDNDSYAISEENLAKIAEIIDTESVISTLDELEALIKSLEDELEKSKNNAELSGEQSEEIDEIEKALDSIKEQAKEELKNEIEKAKEDFKNKKNDRRK